MFGKVCDFFFLSRNIRGIYHICINVLKDRRLIERSHCTCEKGYEQFSVKFHLNALKQVCKQCRGLLISKKKGTGAHGLANGLEETVQLVHFAEPKASWRLFALLI